MLKLLSLVILSAAVIFLPSILPKTRINSSPKAASASLPLGFKITRSLVGTGEKYGIWITTDNVNYETLYSGTLEVSQRYCDDCETGSSGCQFSCRANPMGNPGSGSLETILRTRARP